MKNQPLARGTKQNFSTIIQLKLGHGYFKSYLKRLPKYQNDFCFPAYRRTHVSSVPIVICDAFIIGMENVIIGSIWSINLKYMFT